jgi:hypothetical protein
VLRLGKFLRLKEGEEEALKKGPTTAHFFLKFFFFFSIKKAHHQRFFLTTQIRVHARDHKRKQNAFKSPEQSHAQPEAGSASAPSTETTKKERTRE